MSIYALAFALWGMSLLIPSVPPHVVHHQQFDTITLCRASVPLEIGRCTGSAYCSACRNCSRCAHCNSGGSCGVCADNARTYAVPKRRSPHQYSAPSHTSSSHHTLTVKETLASTSDAKTLFVISHTLNLREGPGTQYPVLEKLAYSDALTFVSVSGDWIKVTTQASETTGFVFWKYVVIEKQ